MGGNDEKNDRRAKHKKGQPEKRVHLKGFGKLTLKGQADRTGQSAAGAGQTNRCVKCTAGSRKIPGQQNQSTQADPRTRICSQVSEKALEYFFHAGDINGLIRGTSPEVIELLLDLVGHE